MYRLYMQGVTKRCRLFGLPITGHVYEGKIREKETESDGWVLSLAVVDSCAALRMSPIKL